MLVFTDPVTNKALLKVCHSKEDKRDPVLYDHSIFMEVVCKIMHCGALLSARYNVMMPHKKKLQASSPFPRLLSSGRNFTLSLLFSSGDASALSPVAVAQTYT